MPAGRPESGNSGGGGAAGPGAAGRTTFRPPWVKEGPNPLPMPTAPWALAHRNKEPTARNIEPANSQQQSDGPPARKTSSIKIAPLQPTENGTTRDPHTFERPKLREVPKAPAKEPTRLQSREVKVPVAIVRKEPKEIPIQVHIESKKTEPAQPPPTAAPKHELQPAKRETPKEVHINEVTPREIPIRREAPPVKVLDASDNIEKAIPAQRNEIVRRESMQKASGLPVPPPIPPPPPPPPLSGPTLPKEPITKEKQEKIETLRSRPRKRPDWAAMMKELETGRKLKHVQCNDRSKPLLPKNKAKGQFIYESEKANLHNQLLRQIQTGANLKHVKCNDRSKPILEGLRKFRRQMTIEEQIQKSQSMANMPEADVEEEPDEMDDIDKVRDDLQSTKQMLALELRNKEAQIRENKRLQARLLNLEAELEKERSKQESGGEQASAADEKLIKSLKDEATEARKTAEDLEKKFHATADQLDSVKGDLEEAKRQNQLLEKKLQQTLQGAGQKRQSVSDRRDSVPGKEPEPPESDVESISESESDSEEEEDNETKQLRRLEREVRLLRNKLKSYKNKEEAAKRERKSLREQMKKNQHAMKQEKKKYHDLQKEVNKMAALMKDDDEEDEEKEDEEDEEETETEESETESESETSEEEESSESETDETPLEKQKDGLQNRAKRHENCLNALKKGNYMLKANVDRLQDDLNKQKEMVVSLQEDLDSVLAELG